MEQQPFSSTLQTWKNGSRSSVLRVSEHREENVNHRRSLRYNFTKERRNIGIISPIDSPLMQKTPNARQTSHLAGSTTTPRPPKPPLKVSEPIAPRKPSEQYLNTKVSAVKQNYTGPDSLGKIYSEIEGVPVNRLLKRNAAGMQPVEHAVFRPPANIEPILLTNATEKIQKASPVQREYWLRSNRAAPNVAFSKTGVDNPRKKPFNQAKNKNSDTSILKSDIKRTPAKTTKKINAATSSSKSSIVNKAEKSPYMKSTSAIATLIQGEMQVEISSKGTNKRRGRKSIVATVTPDQQQKNHQLKVSKVDEMSEGEISPLIFVSPYVTVSRGKENARKEFKQKSHLPFVSPGGDEVCDGSSGPAAAAARFTRFLDREDRKLKQLCDKWTAYKNENTTEEVHNMINVALGQTELLQSKKFNHFKNLIEDYHFGTSAQSISYEDLHGYWDTVLIQISNVKKRFENLDRLKSDNWDEVMSPNRKVSEPAPLRRQPVRKAAAAQKRAASSNIKTLLAKTSILEKDTVASEESSVVLTQAERRLCRISTANSSGTHRKSSLTMILASRKSRDLNLSLPRVSTPGPSPKGTIEKPKSILKSTGNKLRRSTRVTKCVLFKDSDDNSVNDIKILGDITNA